MRRSNRGLLAVLAMVAVAACTAAPKPPGTEVAALDANTTTTVAGTVLTAPTIPGAVTVPTIPGAPAPSIPDGTPTTGNCPTHNGVSAACSSSAQPQPAPPPSDGFRSTLFVGDNDTAGITDTKITLCAHAALTYGAAFNTSADDLNVYWTAINEAGGVYGRKVEVFYENDDYKPDTAVAAATKCKADHNPFILLGGIGFDQIPAVRTWAENNKVLYIHHTATVNGADNLQYSFTFLPSTERTGEVFGEVAVARFRDRKFGIIKRGSENWEPGVRGFKSVAEPAGIDIKLEREVPQNKGSYVQDIVDMRNAGVDTVFVWLNALEATQFITQAGGQDWHPQFMVFPFNLTTQTLGDAALDPPLVGVSMHNAYSMGDYSGPFAPYADDMKQFEAQYAQYRPNADIGGIGGDLIFLNWSSQKAMHQLLLQCGPSCTRNRMVELMHNFKGTPVASGCALDFSRPGPGNDHRGGWAASVMTPYMSPSGKVNWKNTDTCVEHV